MEAHITESLRARIVPIQRDRWRRKILQRAANSDIAFWLEHNIKRRNIIRRRKTSNIVMTMIPPAELEAADDRFLAKIVHARRTTIQDGRMDVEPNDQAAGNGEPPDYMSRG